MGFDNLWQLANTLEVSISQEIDNDLISRQTKDLVHEMRNSLEAFEKL